MTAAQPQRRADRGATDPLTHPMRRRIMRCLHRTSKARTVSEMATELGSTLTMITYHMGVLVTYGTAKEAGLAAEGGGPTYESAVAKNPKVLALLNATETEDEGERAA